jgi:MOSC domain-containing protein YiiM
MEFINGGKIVSLMRYPEKKAPAVVEKELILKQDFGIEGDHHADGGERQISLLTLKEKEWMQNQEVKGFCFKKYKENILLDGISLSECKKGDLIKCGDVVLELTSSIKSCHPELCSLVNEGKCILAGSSRFAKVNCGGTIGVGMSAAIEK